MGRFYSLIQEYKNGDDSKFIDLVNYFDPLLSKFQRDSYYEDIKNELILFLLGLVKKIPIELETFKQDKYIVSYINKSLNNKYMLINKLSKNRYDKEFYLNDQFYKVEYKNDCYDFIFIDMIKTLTSKERNIIVKIYLQGWNEACISRELNISRQAVHNMHIRALNKLKLSFSKN